MLLRLFLTFLMTFLAPGMGMAIAPPYVSDEELAKSPIIVVAKWNKAPLKRHCLLEGNVCKQLEVRTDLVIERVIKGEVKPGTHKALLAAFIGWGEDGQIMSYMSTQRVGDVQDVTHSNLWFLSPGRSWDKTDATEYLMLNTYRGVQPLVLEEYFRALGTEDPITDVPKLLNSPEPLVVRRALTFTAGGTLPWPYEPDAISRWQGVKRRRDPLGEHADAVAKLLGRKEPEVRREAVAVFAELAGKIGVARMRQLLNDPDPAVRAVAIGAVIRNRESGELVGKALIGIKEPHLTCQLIDLLKTWKQPEAVTALITFLQIDGSDYPYGGIPALRAQSALKEVTGYDFPTDVEGSRKAWDQVNVLPTSERRRARLAELLPYDPQPLVGTLVKDAKGAELLLTNRSKRELVLAKKPFDIQYRARRGLSSGPASGKPLGKDEFTELAPGKSIRLLLQSEWADRPDLNEITVYYYYNGNQFGLNAWIGTVIVDAGPR